jgi:E3 ubiquitin-protein ligase RNF14
MDTGSDDDRLAELGTLEAIFPEIRRLADEDKRVTFELDLPVEPAQPVKVTFPAAAENPIAGQRPPVQSVWNGQAHVSEEDSRVISHLPPLSLRLALPEGYPTESSPQARISTIPQWLPSEVVKRLEMDAVQLWEGAGKDMVAYTYIDHLQRAAEDVFGTITDKGTLEIYAEHKLAVLDYDIKARQAAFDKETFDCGICLGKGIRTSTSSHPRLHC